MNRADAIQFRSHINTVIENIDDETAIEVADLFAVWVSGKDYYGPNDPSENPQSRVRYQDLLYKCLISHTSQADWTPDVAVSLWVRVDDPGEEWPEWRQPTGAQDAYELGAKVSHNDKHWISNTPDNVWEPGVYGWDEAVEE